MAKLEPTIEVIKRLKVQPTEGEWTLLHFLLKNLSDDYEIFFQPYINGDNPDIIVMKKDSGVLIIEVKDWNLFHYGVDEKTNWYLKENGARLKSPLKQVENYKENLFNLHIEELFDKKIENKNAWATVSCLVYFHKARESEINNFLLSDFRDEKYKRYRRFVNFIGIWGHDSLNTDSLNSLLSKFWLNKKSRYFDDKLYKSFLRYLKTPFHQKEEGKRINYSKEQKILIKSGRSQKRKIKGIAGCGKTLVLAKRAVNAHIRTKGRVLILTYNITLKNYIHDRISDVREDFPWSMFYITNYHQFFKTQANHYGREFESFKDWDDVDFFDEVKDNIQKFDVILIDEIQDYKQEWIDILDKYFMREKTEFVVFGDEKQNIYERELDENYHPIVRNVPGRWNETLNKSYRFTGAIAKLALDFQRDIMDPHYIKDDILIQSSLDFETKVIEYENVADPSCKNVFNIIYSKLEEYEIHPSDVGILGAKVEFLRELDFQIKNCKNEKTSIAFETKEEYEKIFKSTWSRLRNDSSLNGNSNAEFEQKHKKLVQIQLDKIRKVRKLHFWMKSGTVKLSTIHSFKGWESGTLVLIIDQDDENHDHSELIYTGITRARMNLFIINIGSMVYDHFFQKEEMIETR